MSNVASKVIDKCGGPVAVAEMCKVDVSRVYRWTYPADRGGSGGIIPSKHQSCLLAAARERGIALTPEDFFDLTDQKGAADPQPQTASGASSLSKNAPSSEDVGTLTPGRAAE